MEWLIVVLVFCIVLLAFGLLAFAVWQKVEHDKQINELTSKLMARSVGEYANAKQLERIEQAPKPDKPKKLSDGVLGATY